MESLLDISPADSRPMTCLLNSTLWPGREARLYLSYAYYFFSSSPPLKYLHKQGTLPEATVSEIGTQFTTLLTKNGGCTSSQDATQDDIQKFDWLFSNIKKLDFTHQVDIINALNLNPLPEPNKANDQNVVPSDLLELVVFIRKRMIELAFNDFSLSQDGKTASRRLKVILIFDNNQEASRRYVMQ